MRYAYRIQAEGFNHNSGNVELKPDMADAKEMQIKLHPAIRATIRLAWQSTSLQGGGKTSGETMLTVDGGPPRPYVYGQESTSWLRPVQEKDRLTLQFVEYPYGFGGPFAAPDAWLRVVGKGAGPDVGQDIEAALAEYDAIDLAKIDKLKEELPAPRATTLQQPGNPRPATVLPAELGKVYVGRLQHRDMRTGQPVQLAYKVFVEEMSSDNPSTR
jgi:hypothetical protein